MYIYEYCRRRTTPLFCSTLKNGWEVVFIPVHTSTVKRRRNPLIDRGGHAIITGTYAYSRGAPPMNISYHMVSYPYEYEYRYVYEYIWYPFKWRTCAKLIHLFASSISILE